MRYVDLKNRRWCRIVVAVAWLLACCEFGFAQEPKLQISNVRRVFHNGEHNAFTDLVRFQDQLYLTFRSCPAGHMVHNTASIIVLVSNDGGVAWRQVHRFSVPLRDTRDPHFLVFKHRLFVYTGTWFAGKTTIKPADYDLNLHLGYAAVTDDGESWQSPIMLEGTFGHYIWRAAAFGDRAYLCGRRKQGFDVAPRGEGPEVESLMLESDDGLIWRKAATFQEVDGDETAFQFDDDGQITAVARRGRREAQLLRSAPPYDHWSRTDLSHYVGGPLLVDWQQRQLVGGRQMLPGQEPQLVLYWLVNGQLRQCAELPSGGDCSYPGFVSFDDTHGLLSWYSSHEKDASGKTITAIYLADVAIGSD